MLKGMTVTLLKRVQTGVDGFNAPVFEYQQEDVENVLVGEPSSDDITSAANMYGKHVRYTLGIPKGDTHSWKDQDVVFFGETFHVFTDPIRGIDENIPGPWNAKVMVERYEQECED